jgi:hypothetical protein
LQRTYTNIGGAVAVNLVGLGYNGPVANNSTFTFSGAASYGFGTYPNGANNGLLASPLGVYVLGLQGELPGMLHIPQDVSGSGLSNGALVDATDHLAGRKLVMRSVAAMGSGGVGMVAFDLTGPWQ